MHEDDKMITEEKKIKYTGVKGIPHIREPGNAVRRPTGCWRTVKPVVDHSRCIGCKLCFTVCPDSAYKWKEEKANKNSKVKGKPIVDHTMCKGCGICAEQCPVKCIKMVKDEHEELR